MSIIQAERASNVGRRVLRAGVIIVMLGFATAGFSQSGPCQLKPWLCSPPPPKHLSYDLQITGVTQSNIVEFTPIDVNFTLTVALRGIVGDAPAPTPIDVCPALRRPETTCYHVALATAGRVVHGSLRALAPWAGLNAPLRIVALKPPDGGAPSDDAAQSTWQAVAEDTEALAVAARYEIRLVGFEALTTRSNQTDTVWANLIGMVKTNPPHRSEDPTACELAEFHWCSFALEYGDAGDGPHSFPDVPSARVGPFELVPEREQELRALFYVYNAGYDPRLEIAAGVANGFSKVGMVILSAYGASEGSSGTGSTAEQLDGVMSSFHSSATASCDGPLAAAVIPITNQTIDNQGDKTLDALTRRTGSYSGAPPVTYREKDGDFICDRRGSAYKISYIVYRTSWVPWAQ